MASVYKQHLPRGLNGRRSYPATSDEIASGFLVDGTDVAKPIPTDFGTFVVAEEATGLLFTPTTDDTYIPDLKNGGFLISDHTNMGTVGMGQLGPIPSNKYCEPHMYIKYGRIDVRVYGATAPEIGGQVYVRIANADATHILGGVEAALVTDETMIVPGCSFLTNIDPLTGTAEIRVGA